MSITKITMNGKNYIAYGVEQENGVLTLEDMLPEEILEQAVFCAGNIEFSSTISSVIRAVDRLYAEGISCFLIIEDRNSLSREVTALVDELEMSQQVYYASLPAEYTGYCKEYMDLAVFGKEIIYLKKQSRFIKNDIDSIYTALKNLF